MSKIFDGASLSRFLNEMIKLISPKYLGTRTPECVKQRVIELLYSWTRELPQVIILPYNGNRKNTIPFKTQVSGFFFYIPETNSTLYAIVQKLTFYSSLAFTALLTAVKSQI